MTEKDPDRKRKNKGASKSRISRVPDLDLWEIYTKDFEKLPDKGGDRSRTGGDLGDASVSPADKPVARRLRYKNIESGAGLANLPPSPVTAPSRDMDKRSKTKLKRGDYPIDGTLDLHGLTEAKAHHQLIRFLLAHHENKSRCLLVITGQGRNTDTGRAEGALRRNLPRWCLEAPVAPFILSVEQAQTRHGGNGAFYILLRRQRAKSSE